MVNQMIKQITQFYNDLKNKTPEELKENTWMIDLILEKIDTEINKKTREILEIDWIRTKTRDTPLHHYYTEIRESINKKLVKLLLTKQKIQTLLEKHNLITCHLDLKNDESMEKPLDLKLSCTRPTGYCFTHGTLGRKIWKIETYDHTEYWGSYGETMKHHIISDRWVGYFTCWGHNRVYIREDGSIVISHDMVNHDGVHVIHLNTKNPIKHETNTRKENETKQRD